jgi:hypothetical protein
LERVILGFHRKLERVVNNEDQERLVGRVVLGGTGRRKRSTKAGTVHWSGSSEMFKEGHRNRSSEMFKEGWIGLSKQVVGNVQRRLERVMGRDHRKRSKKAGTSHRNGLSEMFKECWDGSLKRVVGNVQRKIGRVVKNVQRSLDRSSERVVGNVQ